MLGRDNGVTHASMSRLRHRVLAPLAFLVTAILILTLTGCATGDGVAGAFSRAFSGDPLVRELEVSSADNMPFTGGVGGTLTLRENVTAAELRKLTERIRDFVAEHDAAAPERVRLTLRFGDWRLPVLLDEAQGETLLGVVGGLLGDPRVRAASVTSGDFVRSVDSARLVVGEVDAVFPVLAEAPERFAPLGGAPTITVVTEEGAAEHVEVMGAPGPWLDRVAEGYATLRDAVPLTAFVAKDSAITVTLAREGDLARAESIASERLSELGDPVTIQSDLVTLFPGATGVAARALLAELPVSVRGELVSLWTDDRALQLGVGHSAGLIGLATELDRNAGVSTLSPVTLRVGDPAAPSIAVQGEPGALAALTETAASLSDRPELDRVRLSPGNSFELSASTRPSAADLSAYAEALRPFAVADDRICLEVEGPGSFCVIAADRLTAAELNPRATRDGAAFVDAWNSPG